MKNKKLKQIIYSLFILGAILNQPSFLKAQTSNIDPNNKWAWSPKAGWINFNPNNSLVTIYPDHMEGYIYGENIGWIRLGTFTGDGTHTYENTTQDNYGVNNDGTGSLSGYAWSTNTGWINFDGVTVDMMPAGEFHGCAWSENIGWIKLNSESTGNNSYKVATITDNSLSVELSSFSAQQVKNSVILKWVTESEIENLGFILERRTEIENLWEEIASYTTDDNLKGNGSSSTQHTYEHTDNNVQPEITYEYRILDINYSGEVTINKSCKITLESFEVITPNEFILNEAYPNPFNPGTTISYQISSPCNVNLSIYDVRGRLIQQLVQEQQEAGLYSYKWDAGNLSSGIYIYKIEAGHFSSVKKCLLVE